ncbi:hypothetical protein D6C90_08632 [Aureobasidium pullulans]|uniref:Uncharacterized protein n=1 Tax=Aureobasidium pullulans TaxID=5580 RepID=A0A4S9C997_AURPU|nr:hypothetical protein JADG_008516 [Aureobasidium pullulans]THW89503.1 hypothetical protein D6D15_05238 [Aureobasidium pullulans]THX03373.1 hypothetical protein D6D13_07748 [Aureobasidium pullulans]THX26565.1 hypothetical protein D6D12_06108 [Aureobasidium pullulans]THX45159.1 hypothetical protein D6D11_07598 [Aureobasidium pullulans]
MAFRERIKKALRKASPNSSLRTSSTKDSSKDRDRWPSNVYKPGEPMPRAKYRAPVKKEHKEKLESFSFSAAWRRRSFMSEYSPMGTRMPSRRASLISRKSFGGRSSLSRRNSMSMSRRNSVSGAGAKSGRESLEVPRERHAALAPALSTEIEAEGDDDVANVGLSRVQSREDKPHRPVYSRRQTAEYRSRAPTKASPLGMTTTAAPATTSAQIPARAVDSAKFAHDHTPFTEEELARALQRSHLEISAH